MIALEARRHQSVDAEDATCYSDSGSTGRPPAR
jgi:hypothetical protein